MLTFEFFCMCEDVYVFGVGKDVNKKELNDLASKKRGEEHVFILKDYKTLGKVFNKMISGCNVWC